MGDYADLNSPSFFIFLWKIRGEIVVSKFGWSEAAYSETNTFGSKLGIQHSRNNALLL